MNKKSLCFWLFLFTVSLLVTVDSLARFAMEIDKANTKAKLDMEHKIATEKLVHEAKYKELRRFLIDASRSTNGVCRCNYCRDIIHNASTY